MSKTKIKEMSEELVQEEAAKAEALTEASVASPASVPEKSEDEAMRAQETPEDEPAKTTKKAKKPKQGKKERSKKYLEKIKILEARAKEGLSEEEAAELPNFQAKTYPIEQAIELTKELSYTSFDGTVELHINANSKQVRGLVALPFASGKVLKVLAFGKGAEESGADFIGDDKALQEIEKGKVNFDVLVTTAEWMPKLARTAKVLGPKGLMPNPKNGTITTDLKKAVAEIQSGKVEYKTEKGSPVIHLGIGKISQPTEELSQNIRILLTAIGKSKIKKATIAASMSPGVKLDLSSL